jgi:hypothetical protein
MVSQAMQLRITAHATPHNSDPSDAHEFYAMLGMLTVAWGRLEGHIIGAFLMILNLPEAAQFYQPVPLAWEKRLDLWKRAFKTVAALQPHKDRAIAFMQNMHGEAKSRNVKAHAIWDEFVSDSGEVTIAARTVQPKRHHRDVIDVTDYRISVSMLREDLAIANRLNAEFLEFTNLLNSLRPPPSGARTL